MMAKVARWRAELAICMHISDNVLKYCKKCVLEPVLGIEI
jgi:hypothetical protein